jgi:sec-independent protein translocase protein TatC
MRSQRVRNRTDAATAGEMTLLEHLADLRVRVISSAAAIFLCTIPAFVFYDQIVAILFRPFEFIEGATPGPRLFVMTLVEGFVAKIRISLLAGIILSLPVHLYNGIRFVFPGLTTREKRVVVAALCASFVLIVLSIYYSYFNIVPISVRFLTGSGFIPPRVGLILGYEKNIFFALHLMFASLVVFQIPVLLEILLFMHVVTRRTLLRASRFVIVAVFVVSAVLTPPDVLSQVAVAIPLTILYFLTILIAKIFGFGGEA